MSSAHNSFDFCFHNLISFRNLFIKQFPVTLLAGYDLKTNESFNRHILWNACFGTFCSLTSINSLKQSEGKRPICRCLKQHSRICSIYYMLLIYFLVLLTRTTEWPHSQTPTCLISAPCTILIWVRAHVRVLRFLIVLFWVKFVMHNAKKFHMSALKLTVIYYRGDDTAWEPLRRPSCGFSDVLSH
jgi:hypothetical protein